MFQPKARRIVPVLALTAALSMIPLGDASAAPASAAGEETSGMSQLMLQIEAQVASVWSALETMIWGDAGPRMDDNG